MIIVNIFGQFCFCINISRMIQYDPISNNLPIVVNATYQLIGPVSILNFGKFKLIYTRCINLLEIDKF